MLLGGSTVAPIREHRPPTATRGRPHRRVWVATAFAVVALLAAQGVATVAPDLRPLTAVAHAEPKPGEPGGNHSKPGDNKKKNKDNGNNNRSSGSDRNKPGSTQRPSSQDSPRRQAPTSRIDATQIDKSSDADGRGTDNRGEPGTADRTASTDTTAPEQQPNGEQVRPDSPIPPQRPLTPEERAAYNDLRNNTPGDDAAARLDSRLANGQTEYNRDPFNTGTDTQLSRDPDHLIPIRRIVEMPGFTDLDRNTQRAIADSDENIYAAAPGENRSRGSRTFSEYAAAGSRQSGPALDPAYRQLRIGQENEAYGILQQRIDEAWAQQYGRPRVTSGPLEVELNRPPLEVNPQPSPPELPRLDAPPEVPVTQAPVEVAPISVAPQLPPAPPSISYPLPPLRPATPPVIGAPVAPTTFAAPPPAIIPTPPPVANPAALPAWSTPPPGPVAIPTGADPLAALRAEQNALQIEGLTIIDRQEALQALPNFQTSPAAIAEYQALQSLLPQVAARQSAVTGTLAHPPAALAPPPSLWQQAVSGAKGVADAVSSAASSVWQVVTGAGAVPVPVGIPVPVP